MKSRWLLLAVVGGAVLGSAATFVYSADKSGANANVPELKILDSFVGEWQGDFSGRNGNPVSTTSTTEWVLDGRFLLTKNAANLQRGKLEFMTLWGYDAAKKKYHRWVFTSMGTSLEELGTWDPDQQKFTFESVGLTDGSATAVTKIVDANTRTWSYVFRNKEGQVSGEVHGTNTRRQ